GGTVNGGKMSMSRGNVIDPNAIVDEFGVDPFRYFLLREVPFGQDGDFSRETLIARINSDLANDLGNLLHRTLTMIERYADGKVPEPGPAGNLDLDTSLRQMASELLPLLDSHVDQFEFIRDLEDIWGLELSGKTIIDICSATL